MIMSLSCLHIGCQIMFFIYTTGLDECTLCLVCEGAQVPGVGEGKEHLCFVLFSFG